MPFSCVDDGVVVWTRRFRERGGSLRPLKYTAAPRAAAAALGHARRKNAATAEEPAVYDDWDSQRRLAKTEHSLVVVVTSLLVTHAPRRVQRAGDLAGLLRAGPGGPTPGGAGDWRGYSGRAGASCNQQ
ncbi:hypothetical protein JYU34_018459 [Plutella xylostella]|uniref:Uncharacterized protein n=1 Tax=Plutella xylostella TaxID=51655 RepID=A0ABQ7PXN6_PLUXY|nr:hypothetical protein JYU34_018459 [Plutella xylostella]